MQQSLNSSRITSITFVGLFKNLFGSIQAKWILRSAKIVQHQFPKQLPLSLLNYSNYFTFPNKMSDFTGTFVESLIHKLRFIVAIIDDIQDGCSDSNLEISSKT